MKQNAKKITNKLIDILMKKATGFYYEEEVFEYEKTQKNSKINEKQLSFDDLEEFYKNSDRVTSKNIKPYCKMETDEEKENGLVLSKKKVTTHYVQPCISSIKLLLEIYSKEVNDYENMSDDELINLKNKLIGEILNEDNKDNKKH